MERERIIATGLLSNTHIRMLGDSLKQVFPIKNDNTFEDLLKALDDIGSDGSGTAYH